MYIFLLDFLALPMTVMNVTSLFNQTDRVKKHMVTYDQSDDMTSTATRPRPHPHLLSQLVHLVNKSPSQEWLSRLVPLDTFDQSDDL